MDSGLVAGRECGACTACCESLTINEPQLKKHAGVLCSHCKVGQGCQIYDIRPPVCRSWHCVWRFVPYMDDSWRPDRIGLIVALCDPPDGFRAAVKFDVIADPEVLRTENVVSAIAAFVANGLAVFVSAPGPIGYAGGKALLNDQIIGPMRDGNFKLTSDRIWAGYEAAQRVPPVPIDLNAEA